MTYYDGMTSERFLEVQAMGRKGKSHYNTTPVTHDGIDFPTTKEGDHYLELKLRERAGEIQQLECHPKFIITPRCKRWGRTVRERVYTADFKYWDVEKRRWIVEDVKGKKLSDKGNWIPYASGEFYMRFDLARVAYPECDFKIVMR